MSTDQQAPPTGKPSEKAKDEPRDRAEPAPPQPDRPDRPDRPRDEPTGAPPAAKGTTAGDSSGPDESPSRGHEFGSERLSEELLDGSNRNATEALAFDEALQGLGFPTNQQINNFFRADSSRPAVTRERLTMSTLARVRETFVRPGGYRELWRRLEQRALVILCSRPGFGRQQAAIQVLDALCDGRVELLGAGAIGDLAGEDLASHTGYLWAELRDYDDAGAQIHQIERLAEALDRRHSRLVIISLADAGRWPFELRTHLQELTGPPAAEDLLASHVRARVDADRRAQINVILTDPQVRATLTGLSGAATIARFGYLVADAINEGTAIADVCRQAEMLGEDLGDWFSGLTEPEDRAFALALATLHGLSFPTVMAGARQLDERIQRAEDPKGRSAIRPFGRPARQLLGAVEARTATGRLETSYGDVPVTVVTSRVDDYQKRVLRMLWREYPYLHEILLDWLNELVGGVDPFVRGRAAAATGLLAGEDFDYVRGRLLLTWAESGDWNLRRSAAIALRIPVLDVALREVVWKMLDEWAEDDDSRQEQDQERHRRMTAAAALGGPVGATDCVRSLNMISDRLLEYTTRKHQYEHWAYLGNAVVELFGAGATAQSKLVLRRVRTWSENEGPRKMNIALACFIGIVGRPPNRDRPGGPRRAPILRAVAEAESRSIAAYLWRQSLNHRVMAKVALRALRRLADHVESDECADAFVGLVLAIPRTARELQRLMYWTRVWAREKPHPAVLDRLSDDLRTLELTDERA